ncbi:MAG: protein BatD [Candidatus Thioglobus sp.]|nr:MAG: protein BatD [Candidatus Thioglobus sp.]
MIKTIKIFGSLFLLISAPVFAKATASVNQNWFYPGDKVTLTLSVSSNSDNVAFPTIKNIGGYSILFTGSPQKDYENVVNGVPNIKTSKVYIFEPTKSLTIPAYNFSVNGKKQTTKPIKITLKKRSKSKSADDYVLEMTIDKPQFFFGDEANLTIAFKSKKTLPPKIRANVSLPRAKDLLFIQYGKAHQSADKKYNIHKLYFKVNANNFGTFNIPRVVANVGYLGGVSQGKVIPNKRLYSNPLKFKVLPLPDDLKVFGDFKIYARVDKTKVAQGKAVNLTLIIKGNGSFKDIEDFDFDIAGTTIYKDDALVNSKNWQQKFAIIGAKNFTIPSLSLDFFDKITKKKKHISTKPIFVQVKQNEQLIKATTKQPKIVIDNKLKYYYLLAGVAIGLLIVVVFTAFKHKKPSKQPSLIKQIKSTKSDKQLFDLLLPLDLPEFEPVLHQLEQNLYRGATHKINKKAIIAMVKL